MLRLSLLLAALLVTAGPAAAQIGQAQNMGDRFETRRVVRLGTPYTTPISGSAGAYSQTLRGSRPGSVLAALVFTESGDNPCYAEARFRSWQHGRAQTVPEESTNLCKKTYNDQQDVAVSSAAGRTGISAARVGLNRRGSKVKAVAIRGVTLDQDEMGEVRPDPGLDDSFDRPNFREPWKSWASCKDDEVATGVVVHYSSRPGRNPHITGLALQCAPAEILRVTYQAGTDTPLTP